MKFDNVAPLSEEARTVELPLGKALVKFQVTHLDVRDPSYMRIRAKVSKPYRKLIEANALPKDKDRFIVVSAFVQHCVKGWSGVTSEGIEVPFTVDNCTELLIQAPNLFYSLMDEASDTESYLPSNEDAENLSKPSNTH